MILPGRVVTRSLVFAVGLALAGCESSETPGAGEPAAGEPDIASVVMAAEIPQELQAGQAAFEANCSACHGVRALGSETGPPLVNIIYESSHHGDLAFVMAAERGVRAHHWNFGDMPPVPNVSREELNEIIRYVRYLQNQVGIR